MELRLSQRVRRIKPSPTLAVSARGKWLHLIEVYYPGTAQAERHGGAVRAVIEDAPGVSLAPAPREGRAG